MEQSASTQTQPFQNRTHLVLVGSGALNRKAPTTATDPSQFPRIIKLSFGPRFGNDHRLRPDSILARTCFYQLRKIRQAKKTLDEDFVKTLVHALVLSRLDYCNSVLANSCRSDACTTYSYPALRCTA